MHKQPSRSKAAGHSKSAGRGSKRAAPRPSAEWLEAPATRIVREARPSQLEEADWVLDESTVWPVDEEAHPRAPAPHSGLLSTDFDGDQLPVVDPGMSIDPEDFGRQFLRDATEQDNYESLAEMTAIDPGTAVFEPIISEASLEASAQAGFALPESAALNGSSRRERAMEPRSGVVDLMSNVVREGSLFDQPNERGDLRIPVVYADEQQQHLAAQDEPDEAQNRPRRR
jgi:hypothetical protein